MAAVLLDEGGPHTHPRTGVFTGRETETDTGGGEAEGRWSGAPATQQAGPGPHSPSRPQRHVRFCAGEAEVLWSQAPVVAFDGRSRKPLHPHLGPQHPVCTLRGSGLLQVPQNSQGRGGMELGSSKMSVAGGCGPIGGPGGSSRQLRQPAGWADRPLDGGFEMRTCPVLPRCPAVSFPETQGEGMVALKGCGPAPGAGKGGETGRGRSKPRFRDPRPFC